KAPPPSQPRSDPPQKVPPRKSGPPDPGQRRRSVDVTCYLSVRHGDHERVGLRLVTQPEDLLDEPLRRRLAKDVGDALAKGLGKEPRASGEIRGCRGGVDDPRAFLLPAFPFRQPQKMEPGAIDGDASRARLDFEKK